MKLVPPGREYLASYKKALESGWSPDNLRPEAALEELARINADADRFLDEESNPDPRGRKVTLPDGSEIDRLPNIERWMWDGEFCGVIGFRWQPGRNDLPPFVLGHIGFAVVPWKRKRGYATQALREILDDARRQGLSYVELTADETNAASRRVIESNGGRVVGRVNK